MIHPRMPLILVAWLALAPSAGAATFDDGMAYKRAGKLSEAAAIFNDLSANGDVDALEQLAVVHGWMGDHALAIATWDRALAGAPTRPSLLLGKARVLHWDGRDDEALALVQRVLASAPQAADALELAGDIHAAQGDVPAATDYYALAAALDPAGAAADKNKRLQHPRRWRLDAGGAVDHYQPANAAVVQRGNEPSAYAQVSLRLSPTFSLGGGTDYSRQFDLVDWRFNLEGYWNITRDLLVNARVALTPNAQVLPRHEALLGAEYTVNKQWTPLATARISDYTHERVILLMPGLRFQPLGSRFAIEGRYIHGLSDVNQDTHAGLIKLSATFNERWQPYVLVSSGTENQPPLAPATVTTIAAGVILSINDAWSLRFDATHEWWQDTYTRDAIGSGIIWKF